VVFIFPAEAQRKMGNLTVSDYEKLDQSPIKINWFKKGVDI